MDVERAWNAGLTLSQAYAKIGGNKRELISRWRSLKKQYGCACIQTGTRYSIPQRELGRIVQPGVTYSDWLGLTGPGYQLRKCLGTDT